MEPLGLSAELDTLYHIPQITKSAVQWLTLPFESIETARIYGKSKIDPIPMNMEEMFTTWCDGQRMLVTVRNSQAAESLITIMGKF